MFQKNDILKSQVPEFVSPVSSSAKHSRDPIALNPIITSASSTRSEEAPKETHTSLKDALKKSRSSQQEATRRMTTRLQSKKEEEKKEKMASEEKRRKKEEKKARKEVEKAS